MLEELKVEVFRANMELPRFGLVVFTWGNVSAIDRASGLVVIKPGGVDYCDLVPGSMVVVDMDGKKVEGDLPPPSDTATHIELYRACPEIGGVAHTSSTHATVFAQAVCDIPAMGTIHADYFYGDVPCTRLLTKAEIEGAYERETGFVIVETFKKRGLGFMEVPSVIVASHGPFCWGKDGMDAAHNAVVLEEAARMALYTRLLSPTAPKIQRELLDKHYRRRHDAGA
jgi:L-ribulose-5-phosphate 4-epimerase